MPIIDIEIVDGEVTSALTRLLADGLGKAFDASPGKVWVRVRSLDAQAYAENGGEAPKPVFVTITASTVPEGEALRQRIARVVEEVARISGRRRENVHVEFQPAAKGRIAFGGRLVE